MQLIWISGSTSRIRRISITKRTLAKLAILLCTIFILIGAGIHFIGYRFAVQFKPDLAREMGGVITLQERDEIELGYRVRLEQLQDEFSLANKKIAELQTLKDRFTELSTPPIFKNQNQNSGKGGPYLEINFHSKNKNPLKEDIEKTIDNADLLIVEMDKLQKNWERQFNRLEQLPIGSPIANRLGLTSNFGVRLDPFTRMLAKHPGVDFSAPPGTPILAAGNGVVLKVLTDKDYGQFLEIQHADGYITKYAHTRKIYVVQGETVKRGQLVAEVGTTGRSTGPHLHYEIMQHGALINPILALSHLRNLDGATE